jgi:hypothetical protein
VVGEWRVGSRSGYRNPFVDVRVSGAFEGPSGQLITVPAFYDGRDEKGRDVWGLRFNPDEAGAWHYEIFAQPTDADLAWGGHFEVTDHAHRGSLRATPGVAWGFCYEDGQPVFLLGDTVYNLFGMAHCGGDVTSFLERRARQGFNLLRIRLPVSPFHPPDGRSQWQTRRTWPWGGSEQSPRFDRFNLDYFRTVDGVVDTVERLGLGIEMIMEAWGFEYPFCDRGAFTAEWEELWMRYLIARYDAFNCVYFWTLMNEYEYYPDGNWHRSRFGVEDLWAMRVGRWVKRVAQHGHIVSVHNGPRQPSFGGRFALDPEAIDAIMFQTWGTRGIDDGWLAAGVEEDIEAALADWPGSAVLSEYGYERNPELDLLMPTHEGCGPEHTRRGAWRGAFCGLGVVHGFENSWGPWMILEEDQPGLTYLLHLQEFFSAEVPFDRLQPAPELLTVGGRRKGQRPLVLASGDRHWVLAYLPAGGACELALPEDGLFRARWYDPRGGVFLEPLSYVSGRSEFVPPVSEGAHPDDWVLVLDADSSQTDGSPASGEG